MSTKHKPLELANALIAKESAYTLYDAQPTNELKAEAWKAVIIIEERCSQLYAEWQSLGGTSDIETLALGMAHHRINNATNGTVRHIAQEENRKASLKAHWSPEAVQARKATRKDVILQPYVATGHKSAPLEADELFDYDDTVFFQ